MRGAYGSLFFGYAVSNTLENSQGVFSLLSGDSSKKQREWNDSTDEIKNQLLLEIHESAHHQLLTSTPVGLLLWRLNHVITRDIHWMESNANAYGVAPQSTELPRNYYNRVDIFKPLEANGCPEDLAFGIKHTQRNLENCFAVRDIFFSSGIGSNQDYKSITLGELTKMLNLAFDWMNERCFGTPSKLRWKVRTDPMELIFDSDNVINVHDIVEAHAIANEFSTISGFGDLEFYNLRWEALKDTAYFGGVEGGRKNLPGDLQGLDFIGNGLRLRALFACCTSVDLSCFDQSEIKTLYIEDELPWKVYESRRSITYDAVMKASKNLDGMVSNAIHSEKSKWSQIGEIESGDSSQIINNMMFLGFDLQIYTFHRNAEKLYLCLTEYMEHNPDAYDSFATSVLEGLFLVEYENDLLLLPHNLEDIYKERWAELDSIGFGILNLPHMQIMCNLINGAACRNTVARYTRTQVPSPKIIIEKLRKAIHRLYLNEKMSTVQIDNLLDDSCSFLIKVIDNGQFSEGQSHNFLVNDSGFFLS